MEYFDIYNADRTITGQKMARGTKVPKGGYRLIVHICIFNGRGEMLIQKRQPFKHSFSGMWDISCGGSVVFGEKSGEGAEREALEELGLKTGLSKARPHLSLNWNDGFDDYYILTKDIDIKALTLQESEVAEVKWASYEEIIKEIRAGRFIPYHEGLIKLLFELRLKPGAHSHE